MRSFWRAALAAAFFAIAAPAYAASVALLTGPLEPSQTLPTLNGLIVNMNTAFGSAGAGNIGVGLNVAAVANAVNAVGITAGATGVAPIIGVGNSAGQTADANVGIVLTGNGTGRACLAGTTAANASLCAVTTASAVNQVLVTGAATGNVTTLIAGGSGADAAAVLSIASNGTGTLLLGGGTTTLAGLQVLQPASRVNDFVLTPTATGSTPGFEAGGAGSDATLGVAFGTQGTGAIAFDTAVNVQQFAVTHTATAVDYLNATGSAAGSPGTPTLSALGTDTNINMVLLTKAAGNVKLGTSTASTCTGTTTATCQGQRFVASVTGLTTAASTLSAAMTVTDANVVSSSASVVCQANGYAGTGIPVVVNIVPGTGSVAFNIQNVSTGAALNATVPVACVVLGT
jgi:hypothetical protein